MKASEELCNSVESYFKRSSVIESGKCDERGTCENIKLESYGVKLNEKFTRGASRMEEGE